MSRTRGKGYQVDVIANTGKRIRATYFPIINFANSLSLHYSPQYHRVGYRKGIVYHFNSRYADDDGIVDRRAVGNYIHSQKPTLSEPENSTTREQPRRTESALKFAFFLRLCRNLPMRHEAVGPNYFPILIA